MPYKVLPKAHIKRLTKDVQEKRQALQQLEAEQAALTAKHSLLNSMLAALGLLAGRCALPGTLLAEGELHLLSQLQHLPLPHSAKPTSPGCKSTSSSGVTSAESQVPGSIRSGSTCNAGSGSDRPNISLAVDSDVTSIAPADDPLRLLLHILTARCQEQQQQQSDRPPASVEKLRAEYQRTIATLAANMGQLDAQHNAASSSGGYNASSSSSSSSSSDSQPLCLPGAAPSSPLDRIQQGLQQYWMTLASMLLDGHGDILPAFIMSDVITGQRLEQHNQQLYKAVRKQLQLSDEQQHRIVTSLRLFQELTEPLLRARKQLQEGVALAPKAALTEVPRLGLGEPFRRQEIVQQQQELWRRQGREQLQHVITLQLLLRKEAVVKFCMCMAIEGCLTWKQMAKFALTCFPHPFSPIALAQAVQAQLEPMEI